MSKAHTSEDESYRAADKFQMEKIMKTITLQDFLTAQQIQQAKKIYNREEFPAKEICKQVIEPNIEEINKKLGQENDSMYLAYACEYVFGKMK